MSKRARERRRKRESKGIRVIWTTLCSCSSSSSSVTIQNGFSLLKSCAFLSHGHCVVLLLCSLFVHRLFCSLSTQYFIVHLYQMLDIGGARARSHPYTQSHHIHNFVRNQICRLCTPTWIQIIRAGQWGSGCRIAFYSTVQFNACFFSLSLGRFLFVLLNLFGFRWMLCVTLLLLSNQTHIQRDCSHWALNGDGFLLFVRVSEWVCHIWAVSRQ